MFPEYEHCELCPRRCGANRAAGQKGFCGEPAELRIAAIEPHFGEEPPLVGKEGSGTVFLTGCSCGCFFCQNYQLSTEHVGDFLSVEEAAERILAMAAKGVRNINFVTPDHYWPHLRAVLKRVREGGCELPVIWNSSGYSSVKTLADAYDNGVEIFLPDFKYSNGALARTCMGREDYPEVAMEALKFLVDTAGFLRPFDETGEMAANRGVLVRHLVLPGEVENSLGVLKALYNEFGPGLPISVMRQFRPMPECHRRGLFTRVVNDDEYRRVMEAVEEFGFYKVFLQPDAGDENFIPDFRHQGEAFKGNAIAQGKEF
ncbi:MAG: radical SAM protein [Lentisphaeria bacterium]|nr:radical SAM protein [Lentisphaeria bacterium]